LKNFIVTVEWGDEFPAMHFFQAVSWEELECSDAFQKINLSYPSGLEMKVYRDVNNEVFNEKLKCAKEFQKLIDKRNDAKIKAFNESTDRIENEGSKVILADWNEGVIYSMKRGQYRNSNR